MKFGQLTEYIMRRIFLEKSYTKSSEETSPRSFSKKSKFLRINTLKFNSICFYCMPSQGLTKCIETKVLKTWFYLIKSHSVILPTLFSAWFLRKNISHVTFY